MKHLVDCTNIENIAPRNEWIYERLDYSLSPEYIWDKLKTYCFELIDFDKNTGVIQSRDSNVSIQLKVNLKEYRSHSYIRKKFDEILNFCNWMISSKYKSGDSYIIVIEPSKPTTQTIKITTNTFILK